MHHRIKRAYTIVFAAGILLMTAAGTARAVPADAARHWSEPAVKDLMKRGVLTGYPDRTFKPDRLVSRAEFARMAVKAFGLPAAGANPFKDLAGHWAKSDAAALAGSGAIEGYADGTFRPDKPVTRAEMVAALGRLLKIGNKEQVYGQNWTPVYPDVPKSHWAFRYVEAARRLDYLPPSYGVSFLPSAAATRAEAAWMIDRILKLERTTGTVMEANPEIGTFTVMPADGGDPVTVKADPDALVLRNNSEVSLDKILVNDELLALNTPDGSARLLKAGGRVNAGDLAARLNGWTKGILTPETVTAIASGDWTMARQGLESVLFDRLVEMGLGPGEVQSLLDQDWVTLDLLSRDKLIMALSSRLGVSTDLAESILSRDLGRLKELAQTEIAAAALGRLLQPQV